MSYSEIHFINERCRSIIFWQYRKQQVHNHILTQKNHNSSRIFLSSPFNFLTKTTSTRVAVIKYAKIEGTLHENQIIPWTLNGCGVHWSKYPWHLAKQYVCWQLLDPFAGISQSKDVPTIGFLSTPYYYLYLKFRLQIMPGGRVLNESCLICTYTFKSVVICERKSERRKWEKCIEHKSVRRASRVKSDSGILINYEIFILETCHCVLDSKSEESPIWAPDLSTSLAKPNLFLFEHQDLSNVSLNLWFADSFYSETHGNSWIL